MPTQKVIIIGAGLSGSLLAIYLAKRGIQADVFEARGDMRKEETSAGRSINLALSNRGIAALKEVGLDEYMLAEAVPMYGRMIHSPDGGMKLLPYSGREGEYINSVSRAGLNVALINEAEKYDGVKFHFNAKCAAFDCRTGEAELESGEILKAETVIGTDGAGSVIRNAMFAGVPRFNFSQSWLEHGYKELHIPPSASGDFQMEKNALHIWARGSFMMIALPNFDGSFTCTLFLAHEGENSFAQLRDEKSLMSFFEKNFADAIPLMPTLAEDFFANPTGNLGTVKCFPWNVRGKSLLIGDAAHAVVPFYGQGMNASFEDCRILNELIDRHDADWATIFDEFTAIRKPNADAIAEMAEENFYEMRDAVADAVFQRKRELETRLEQTFPDYFSKYSMVTFREDLPYKIAREKGNAQDKLLMEICAGIEDAGELDLEYVMSEIKSLTNAEDEFHLPEPVKFKGADMIRDGGSYYCHFLDEDENLYEMETEIVLDRGKDWKKVGYKAPVLRCYDPQNFGQIKYAEKITWDQAIELAEKIKPLIGINETLGKERAFEMLELLKLKGRLPQTN